MDGTDVIEKLTTLPHAPQFCASVWKSLQDPEQRSGVDAGHAHDPLLQVWPAGQTLPQEPQLAESDWKLTQVRPQRSGVGSAQAVLLC
jgi:hypothetical protein